MISFFACIAAASAYNVTAHNVTTSTEVVTAYTTYCPHPTTFTEGSRTFTVTEPTTLTISDCPCTRTHTYSTATVTVCPSSSAGSDNNNPAPPVASGSAAPSKSHSGPVLANAAAKQNMPVAAALGAAAIVAGLL